MLAILLRQCAACGCFAGLQARAGLVCRPSQELVAGMQKMVKQEAESTRVSIRQARRDAVDRAKAIVSKNDKARAERQVSVASAADP